MSTGSFFKALFGPINKAVNWITADDEKLRRARARAMEAGETAVEEDDKSEGKQDTAGLLDEEEKGGVERFADEYNVWEEIDSYRTTFWFGSRMGKYLSRARTKDAKLKKELDELDRKREEEKMKGDGN